MYGGGVQGKQTVVHAHRCNTRVNKLSMGKPSLIVNEGSTTSELDHGAGHEKSAEHTYGTQRLALQPRQQV